MNDVVPVTHAPNTVNQKDYGLPLSQLVGSCVGTCSTSADTQTKDVTIISGSFPFNVSESSIAIGREVLVTFTNANTATSPILNINGISASIVCIGGTATVGSGCWGAGATMKFTYTGTSWIMHSTLAQATSEYSIMSDGTYVYSKSKVDSLTNGKQQAYYNDMGSSFTFGDDNGVFIVQANCSYVGTPYYEVGIFVSSYGGGSPKYTRIVSSPNASFSVTASGMTLSVVSSFGSQTQRNNTYWEVFKVSNCYY